ncbi:hypothetical protein KJ641_00750 [Patescibacteria group bacterium]|nr:hypothetical protein [Patescibacteria group bacterium]MBU1895388.1 hypothetical protein [Patescibacteria group bacterium]
MSFSDLLEWVVGYLTQPMLETTLDIFTIFGWIFLGWLLLVAGFKLLATYKVIRYDRKLNYILLAVDVPPLNEQTPKAMEQLYTQIYNVMKPASIGMTYWHGFRQFDFSFEIISIEGYIQFIIRTLDKYKDVVEAAVYAQYPDAEITEVEDYVNVAPKRYPNETHNIWSCEFILQEDQAYPIRTYEEFEHSITKDAVLKDPMSAFLESFSRIGPGEQVWFQMMIEPVRESEWKEGVIKKIKEEIGEKTPAKPNFFLDFLNEPSSTMGEVKNQLLGQVSAEAAPAKKDNPDKNSLLYMTPGAKKIVESMENKIRKTGFRTKIRFVYLAEKAHYNPSRCINSVVGAMNQFSIPTSNSLKCKLPTSAEYFMSKQRENRRRNILMGAYKSRDMYAGKDPYILNIEELATVWHFPMSYVTAPLLQKAVNKSAEPPPGLPVEGVSIRDDELPNAGKKEFSTDAGPEYSKDQQFG